MSASSFSPARLRMSPAVGPPAPGSRLMSRGPSARNENPRSGSSSWTDEIPRSRSIPSKARPSAASRSRSRSAKSAWTARTQGNPRSRSRAVSSIRGSASAHTRRPPGPILRAISSACPPAPAVPSRNTEPAAGASSSRVSRRRTGMWPLATSDPQTVYFAGQLGILESFLLEPSHLHLPLLAGPDLEPLRHSRDDHIPLEAGVDAERRRDEDPPLFVRDGLDSAADKEAQEGVQLAVHARHLGELLLDPAPLPRGVDVETPRVIGHHE